MERSDPNCPTRMKRNTIVTIGDRNYLWGLFLLIASARKTGMEEPFLVGTQGFTPHDAHILAQLGNVSLVSLDHEKRSLTCGKPQVMLQAQTPFVTWADCDAFFTGNVSELLPPANPDEIHFRLRSREEMLQTAFVNPDPQADCLIPPQMLEAWRSDLAEITGGKVLNSPRHATTGSACFCALSLATHRRFLETWEQLATKVLPMRNNGVVDRTLKFYPQLDESTLNACLNFLPDAPEVQGEYQLNRDRARLFIHFIAQPKPWQGWTRRAFRFFDEYVAVVEWACDQGFDLPTPIPYCLRRSNKTFLRMLLPWMTLKPKLAKRLKWLR